MKYNIAVTGAQAVRDKIAFLSSRLSDLSPAYKRAVLVPIRASQARIQNQNGGTWPPQSPNTKTSYGSLLYRTGVLFRSLAIGATGNTVTDLGNGIQVSTNIQTPRGGYNIGALQQYGTRGFASGRGAIPARPFFFISGDDAQRIVSVFESYIMGAPDAESD
jgi:phage gpG-like protein